MGMAKREIDRDSHMSKRSRSPPQTRGSAAMPAPAVLIPPVKSWAFLVASTESGLKSISVAHQQRPIVLSIQNAFSPFEPSAFVEGGTRNTLPYPAPEQGVGRGLRLL